MSNLTIFRKDQYFDQNGRVVFHLKTITGPSGEAEFFGVTEVVIPDHSEDPADPENPRLPVRIPFTGITSQLGLGGALERCFASYDERAAEIAGKTIAEFRDFKAKKQAEEAVAVAKAPHVLHEERHIALGQEDSVRRPSILIP